MATTSAKAARIEAIQSFVNRPSRQITYPKTYTADLFATNVFGVKQLSETLPKPVFQQFQKQTTGHQVLSKEVADAVAHAVRIWAMDRGATHFTHWFQPQTDATAEKHDTFLTMKYATTAAGLEITPMDAFSGSQLLQAEPDASSFPNGGVRATFEARGYTVWDTTSPMFVQDGPHGTSILYIPSIFISYNGEALDEKTFMLRSVESISKAAVKLLEVLGDNKTKNVIVTLGTEQEYFLIDRGLYSLRPDLKITGRALIGSLPPKHQQMEDHYFGRIPSRVLSCMSEVELELWKLGVPVKTRHNEVAPAQFELAPTFEEASVAVDHNLLTMDVLHKVAHRYKLKVLFHEKPFKGVNGSGKHCNWSLSTDQGVNLLEPGPNPETNYPFLLVLVATLYAVHKHAGVLRAGIASASNEHRLGANEAPPGIISAFLGDQLTEVLNAIEQGRPVSYGSSKPHVENIKLGGRSLDMKISTLPEIQRDLTDRNRTSPFAFTGNKFEFRAVGSKQSPSFPVTLLNAAVSAGLQEVTRVLTERKGSKAVPSTEDILAVVKHFTVLSKPIRFEGNGYSQAWRDEAAKRGLPNISNCPDAFKQLIAPVNAEMLTRQLGIFSESELHSRFHVLNEKYVKDLLVEVNTLISMLQTGVLPALIEYRLQVAQTVQSLEALKVAAPERALLEKLSPFVAEIQQHVTTLQNAVEGVNGDGSPEELAVKANALVGLMAEARKVSDAAEVLIRDDVWPYPKYTELLFTA